MKKTLLAAISALLLGPATLSAATTSLPSFLPENDMKIPVGSPQARGITEAQFNAVLDAVEEVYAPIVQADGGVLSLVRKWTDDTVNAYAQQSGSTYRVTMFGGLARHKAITMDGFALVACHELGHHLGGAPKISGWWNSWASIEGQSDYYAVLKCMRRVFSAPSASTFSRPKDDDQIAINACSEVYDSADKQDTCIRSAMAGKSVTGLFQALHNSDVPVLFSTPDTTVVTTMMTKHPPSQCRLDTYLAGALCDIPVDAPLSNSDQTVGVCTRSGGFKTGFRPLCWYKPAKAAELLPPGIAEFAPNTPAFSVLRTGLGW